MLPKWGAKVPPPLPSLTTLLLKSEQQTKKRVGQRGGWVGGSGLGRQRGGWIGGCRWGVGLVGHGGGWGPGPLQASTPPPPGGLHNMDGLRGRGAASTNVAQSLSKVFPSTGARARFFRICFSILLIFTIFPKTFPTLITLFSLFTLFVMF